MPLENGDILHAYCAFIPDYKYVVCICSQARLFFLINSKPRKTTPDAQVLIEKENYPFLEYDSYINTATVITIYPAEISKAKLKGKLSETKKAEVARISKQCGYLTLKQKNLIENNFSAKTDNGIKSATPTLCHGINS